MQCPLKRLKQVCMCLHLTPVFAAVILGGTARKEMTSKVGWTLDMADMNKPVFSLDSDRFQHKAVSGGRRALQETARPPAVSSDVC